MMDRFKLLVFLLFVGCISSEESFTIGNEPDFVSTGVCSEISIQDGQIRTQNLIRSTAGFAVEEVDVEVDEVGSSDNLPSKFTLIFTVKRISGVTPNRPPLQGAPFQILTYQEATSEQLQQEFQTHTIRGDDEQRRFLLKEVFSDNSGEIKWQETYEYFTPGHNQWIYFERVIRNESGEVVIPFIINPWLQSGGKKGYDLGFLDSQDRSPYIMPSEDNEESSFYKKPSIPNPEVRNCVERRSLSHIFKHLETKPKPLIHVPEIQMALNQIFLSQDDYETHGFRACTCPESKQSNLTNSSVCIQKISQGEDSEYPCEEKGLLLVIDPITIPLRVKVLNSVGNIEERELKNGRFRVKPILVALLENNERYPLHTSEDSYEESLNSGTLKSKLKFHIPFRITDAEQMELWLEITDESQKLKPFFGVYNFLGSDNVVDLQSGTKIFNWSESSAGTEIVGTGSEETQVRVLVGDLDQFYDGKNLFEYFGGNKNPNELQDLQDQFTSQLNEIIFLEGREKNSLAHFKVDGIFRAFNASLLTSEFQRMRYTRVVIESDNQSENQSENQCESIVERTVSYQGTVDFKKPDGQSILATRGVVVKVEEYILSEDLRKRVNSLPESQREDQTIVSMEDLENVSILCKSNRDVETHEYVNPSQGLCQQSVIGNGKYLTDTTGAFSYYYNLKHYVYEIQKFFPRKFIFEINGHAPVTKFFVFNPWEYGFLTYQNYTNLYEAYLRDPSQNQELIRQIQSGKNPPELRVSEYRSSFIEPSYKINNSLEIDTVRNFVLSFRPAIVRIDSIGSTIRTPPLPLPVGPYVMRVIILKGPQETTDGAPIVSPSETILADHKSREMGETIENFRKQVEEEFIKLIEDNADDSQFEESRNDLPERFEETLAPYRDTLSRNSLEQLNTPDYATNLMAFRQNVALDTTCLPYNPNCLPIFQSEDYIDHYDTVVYSDNGTVNAFVNLDYGTDDFRLLGSKISIVIQLLPTDPKENYNNKQCQLDYKKSKFKPFYNHDLITQPHWAVASLTDFGNAYAMRPIDEVSLDNLVGEKEHHRIKPLEIAFDDRNNIQIQNENLKNILDSVHERYEYLVEASSEEQLDDRVDKFKNEVQGFENFCEPDSSNEIYDRYKECLCGQLGDPEGEQEEVLFPEDEKIKDCFVVSDTEEILADLNLDVERIKIEGLEDVSQRDRFCAEEGFYESYDSNERDISGSGDKYRNCVCQEARNGEELTFSMAECFAQQQGLKMLDSSTLVSELNVLADTLNRNKESISSFGNRFWLGVMNRIRSLFSNNSSDQSNKPHSFQYLDYNSFESKYMDGIGKKMRNFPNELNLTELDLNDIIENGFNYTNNELIDPSLKTEPQGAKGSFLHLMCTFWFNNYYDNHMDVDQIKQMFRFYQDNRKILEAQSMIPDVLNAMSHLPKREIQTLFEEIKNSLQTEDVLEAEDLLDVLEAEDLLNSDVLSALETAFEKNKDILTQLEQLKFFVSPFDTIHLESLKEVYPFDRNSVVNVPQFGTVYAMGPRAVPTVPKGVMPSGGKEYVKCLKNPLYFFHFERKVMVGDLSSNQDNFDYKNGYVFDISLRESMESNARKSWGTRLAFNTSSDLKLSTPWRFFGADYRTGVGRGLTIDNGLMQSTSSGEINFVNLAVNHIRTQIGLNTYKQCLVIRPKNKSFENVTWDSSFSDTLDSILVDVDADLKEELRNFIQHAYSQFGLFICGDEKSNSPLQVHEDYYYVHQFFGGHGGEFMSRTIFNNRPFVELIRGKSSFDKFLVSLGDDSYTYFGQKPDNYDNFLSRGVSVNNRLIEAFNDTKLDWAGFHKGIYTYPSVDHYYFTPSQQREGDTWRSQFLDLFYDTLFPAPKSNERIANEPSVN